MARQLVIMATLATLVYLTFRAYRAWSSPEDFIERFSAKNPHQNATFFLWSERVVAGILILLCVVTLLDAFEITNLYGDIYEGFPFDLLGNK